MNLILRIALGLLSFGLLAPALTAYAPRPSSLMVQYKGKTCPVVGYFVEECTAMVDGQKKSIWRPGGYALKDAAAYGDNYVEAGVSPLGGPVTIQKLGGPHLTQMPDTLTLYATLTTRKTIKGGFTVVGLFSLAQLSDPFSVNNGPQLIIESLPPLPAGQPVPVEISLGAATPPRDPHFFVLIFDENGQEVLTSGSQYAWEYFGLCDQARLKVAVKKYLEKFPGADHDAVPALMPKPIFPPGSALAIPGLSALLTVTEVGHVSEVKIQGSEDPAVIKPLAAALEGWLFLPRLKAGQPVPVKIQVPLHF